MHFPDVSPPSQLLASILLMARGRFDVAGLTGRFDVAGLTGRSVHFWHFFAFPFRWHIWQVGVEFSYPPKLGSYPTNPNIKISRNRL